MTGGRQWDCSRDFIQSLAVACCSRVKPITLFRVREVQYLGLSLVLLE
jgi:hypothetical protein